MNPLDQEYLDWFNRSFVSLCWVDCESDTDGTATLNPRMFCTSGFVIDRSGEWFWITAGHLLNDLQNELRAMNRRIVQSYLLAGWDSAAGAVARIPFDINACFKYYEDDEHEGTDLGVVFLPEEHRQNLVNSGVAAITNLDCPEQEYDRYVVHGLPSREQRDSIEQTEDGIECSTSIMPVAFQVFPLPGCSGGFSETTRDRFYASVPAEVQLDTLDGVSGGPIYGLRQVEGRVDCHLIAVQNRERKTSRTIAACPSPLFHEILAKGIAEIQRQREEHHG